MDKFFSLPGIEESSPENLISQDNISMNYLDTQSLCHPQTDMTFDYFMSELSDSVMLPNQEISNLGDDLVTYVEQFSKEIQEPCSFLPTNHSALSAPILDVSDSEFSLANLVGTGSTSELLAPLLSPADNFASVLGSPLIFEESDILNSNEPVLCPGNDIAIALENSQNPEILNPENNNIEPNNGDITPNSGDMEAVDTPDPNDAIRSPVSIEDREEGKRRNKPELEKYESGETIDSDSESQTSDSSVPKRLTRSQAQQQKIIQEQKPAPPKRSRPTFVPPPHTRNAAKYRIQTRSKKTPISTDLFLEQKPKLDKLVRRSFRINKDLKSNNVIISPKISENNPVTVTKNRSKGVKANKISENIVQVKEEKIEGNSILDENLKISSEQDLEMENISSLDTNSSSKMLDCKINIIPCSPRTPKKTENTPKQVSEESPLKTTQSHSRRKLQFTPDDTYNRYVPPLPAPPTPLKRKRGRPRKVLEPKGEVAVRRSRRPIQDKEKNPENENETYVPSSSENTDTDSESEERDQSYGRGRCQKNKPLPTRRPGRPPTVSAKPRPPSLHSDEEVSDEDILSGESRPITFYSTYRPSRLNLGYPHPDPIVETSTLSSVTSPNIWFDLSLPNEVLATNSLSDMQLEAVVYACQQHCNILSNGDRAGFLIGDGAGVGKGRIVAGIIYQNYLEGKKKALWLSVSNDLRYDAMRDLRDIGANRVSLHPLNKFKYGKISGKRNGNVKKGVVFSTYSSLISGSAASGKYRTRLSQILHWLGPHFEGVIVLDECHRAKNLFPTSASMRPSKTGNVVLELQRRLPKARIVYCSATGASEPKHMAYMVRLGLWGQGTQFQTFQEFNRAVEKGGVGAMELVAMDMKLRGLYVSRQLSFNGVQFQMHEVPLTAEYIKVYDMSCVFWVDCKQKFLEAMDLLSFDNRKVKGVMALFWAAHQRFFKYLCIASKVQGAVRLAKQALRDGKCVVIGLQSTGEARLMDVLEEKGGELSEFVSSAKGVLANLIQKHFPAPYSTGKKIVTGKERHNLTGAKSVVGGDVSDSPAGSNPDKDSALESDVSNSNSDTSEDNWDTVPPLEYADRRFSRFISSSSQTSDESEEDLNPFAEGAIPWLSKKKSKKQKLESEDEEPHNSMPAPTQSEVVEATKEPPQPNPSDAYHRTKDMKQELLRKVEEIGVYLPNNTLDELIDCLGGPNHVAEMSGRKGRVVATTSESALTEELQTGIKYEARSCLDVPIDLLNMEEKRRFMDGEVLIAIISEVASSGISLHADKRYKNQRQRLHITLELPWTADKAVQQFGRTHRSNQAIPPQYLFLISELGGERRFASVIARRLESLGALTKGDRKATGVESNDFSRFNFDTRDGLQALDSLLRSLTGRIAPLVTSLRSADQSLVQASIEGLMRVDLLARTPKGKVRMDKENNSVAKFLNRILGMEVHLQNTVFQWFLDTFEFLVRQEKRLGRWDEGIVEMGTTLGEEVERVKVEQYLGDPLFGTGSTRLSTIRVLRGLSWEEVLQRLPQDNTEAENEGIYLSVKAQHGKYYCLLVLATTDPGAFVVYRPNIGRVNALMRSSDLQQTYRKVTLEEAKPHWNELYNESLTKCRHKFLMGKCRFDRPNNPCEVGLRSCTKYILSGSVLGVWSHLCRSLTNDVTGNFYIQVVRLYTTDLEREVGILIPPSRVEVLREALEQVDKQACGDYETITVTEIGTNEMEIGTMDAQIEMLIEKPSSDSDIS